MLLETADMLPGEGEEAPRQAFEIVELCGRLPLTVAIAGGMVGNYGVLDDRLVQILREDQFRGEQDGVTRN